MRWNSQLLASILILAGCSSDNPEQRHGAPERLTLYSLDPCPADEAKGANSQESFHGYPVLGKLEVTDSTERRTLMAALIAAVEPGGKGSKCFEPRHGIRVVENGRLVEYVICFKCSNYVEFTDGKKKGHGGSIDSEPQPTFNKLLTDAGIRIAPKTEK